MALLSPEWWLYVSSDSFHSFVWLTPKVRKIIICYPAFQGLALLSIYVRGQYNERIHYVGRRCQLNFQLPPNHSREKRPKLIRLRPNGCQGHGSPGESWEEWCGHSGQEMKKVTELIGERRYTKGQKDNFKVVLRRLITSLVSKIITTCESLCSKFFLSMGNFRWTTVILVIIKAADMRRAQHWGRHSFSSTTKFRTVTLGQSPCLPEPQQPHLEDGYDCVTHVTGLLLPSRGALDVHKTHFGGRSPTHGEDTIMTNNSYCALLPSDDIDLSLSQVGTQTSTEPRYIEMLGNAVISRFRSLEPHSLANGLRRWYSSFLSTDAFL